jgi:APA family basic amino acid/polyamine antiporter
MQLKKSLGLFDIFAITSGAMIGSGLFILPGMAYAKAGPAVIIAYPLAGLFLLAGMFSIAEMITAMPRAGGDIFSIMRTMGPAIGTVAGLLSWFSLSMKAAFALVGIAVFTNLVVNIDVRLIAILFCIIFVVINYIGTKEASRTQVVLVSILFALMLFYVFRGIPAVHIKNFTPFSPAGTGAIFSTAGFVFVSYAGLLKIASIAEEIKEPSKNIPLGMVLSLLCVSVFYILMVGVTVGVLDAGKITNSMTPISDGAEVFLGTAGKIALSIAAVLAFLTTANAGIMTASRSLVPLSRDQLLPDIFSKINKRFVTPHFALIFTGLFIIASFFLQLEVLVKAASTVFILTNLLACLSVLILRESHLQNYQPSFRVPLYPWLQILGVVGMGFLIFEMGKSAWLISSALIVGGFITYWLYGKTRGWREYAFLHLIERITNRELVDGHLETDLKEIIRERDGIITDRFDDIIEDSIILDIGEPISVAGFFKLVADKMAERFEEKPAVLYKLFMEREAESTTVLHKHIAVPHIIIEGEGKFGILIARCRKGVEFSPTAKDIHAIFVLAGTKDERNFHLRALAAFAQIIQDHSFERKWLRAKRPEILRDIILLGKRRRA